MGALVLDRAVVKPGDILHVTGYLQLQKGAKLAAPAGYTSATLRISPGFEPDAPQFDAPVTIDPVYGSIHAKVCEPPVGGSGWGASKGF